MRHDELCLIRDENLCICGLGWRKGHSFIHFSIAYRTWVIRYSSSEDRPAIKVIRLPLFITLTIEFHK